MIEVPLPNIYVKRITSNAEGLSPHSQGQSLSLAVVWREGGREGGREEEQGGREEEQSLGMPMTYAGDPSMCHVRSTAVDPQPELLKP